jgi:folate-binding protein YgfZ
MNDTQLQNYQQLVSGGLGFYRQQRGLVEVWGKEAVQFLNGLITNDVATLADGAQMLAAFPNAQGRLIAVVRVIRRGDKFIFESEGATRDKVFQTLFRFTFAGDFFVEDSSDKFACFTIFGDIETPADSLNFDRECFVPVDTTADFQSSLAAQNAVEICDDLYEVLRIERGIPKYNVDMDENTIVPELGFPDLISYQKGCYIGQEIIARIHFRGHVAKQLTGLVLNPSTFDGGVVLSELQIFSPDGKNAGRVTSLCFSPKLGKLIALAYVRYGYLAEGTELRLSDRAANVKILPFLSI